MVSTTAFDDARDSISHAFERKTSLSEPFLAVVPATGASVSVLNSRAGQATMSSSDETAFWLDELQFDLGEGPCWDAMANHAPVLRSELNYEAHRAWPMFTEAVFTGELGSNVVGVFAFPLVLGTWEVGAVDLYSSKSLTLTEEQVADASALARLATWQVVRRLLEEHPDPVDNSLSARREVHQASGMILAQLNVTIDDAQLLLRAHAYSTNRSVAEVAADVVARKLDFAQLGEPTGEKK